MEPEGVIERLASKLGSLNVAGNEDQPPKVLEDLTIEGVVTHIKKLQSSENSELLNYMISSNQDMI